MAEADKLTREPIPALFEQCLEVYEAMAEQASMQQAYPDLDEEFLVYEGFLTRLIVHELHYSNPYYTKVTKRLKAMDCIRQIKRGGSTAPSRWALLQTPTLELFRKTPSDSSARVNSKEESLLQQVRDLAARLDKAGL